MGYTGDKKREYQRVWIKARRDAWFAGKTCVRCGASEQLEADHVDPSTKVCNPRAIWSRSQEFRDIELAKCQVLCHDCHVDKSAIEKMSFEHNASQYRKGCRCNVCKDAQRVRIAGQRARR